jgi:hypothetical protein
VYGQVISTQCLYFLLRKHLSITLMFPSLTQLSIAGKRRKKGDQPQYLPCPNELKYEQDEYLNLSRNCRVQGGSSIFRREHNTEIDLDQEQSEAELKRLSGLVTLSMQSQVISELYRTQGFETTNPEPSSVTPNLAYQKVFDNKIQRQYYLQRVEQETTLTHIILSGSFWNMEDDNQSIDTRTCAYTTGFVWCNTSPNWIWKKSDGNEPLIRCRIVIPSNTQVVVDRSPVLANKCQFDKDSTSLFPDVLLPPGEFEIDSVVYYRSKKKQGDQISEEDESKIIEYVEQTDSNFSAVTALTDNEYAAKMLSFCSEFVDVTMRVTRMMTLSLPDPPVIQ